MLLSSAVAGDLLFLDLYGKPSDCLLFTRILRQGTAEAAAAAKGLKGHTLRVRAAAAASGLPVIGSVAAAAVQMGATGGRHGFSLGKVRSPQQLVALRKEVAELEGLSGGFRCAPACRGGGRARGGNTQYYGLCF